MDYTKDIDFEWDERKSQLCERQRGFSFRYAAEAFKDPKLITLLDLREDYKEQRWICYGHINDRLYCIVITIRTQKIRIISARKANKRERNKYDYYLLHPETRGT